MIATYRLQLTPQFGFDAARDLVPYLRALKDVFDPNGILNPGKIF